MGTRQSSHLQQKTPPSSDSYEPTSIADATAKIRMYLFRYAEFSILKLTNPGVDVDDYTYFILYYCDPSIDYKPNFKKLIDDACYAIKGAIGIHDNQVAITLISKLQLSDLKTSHNGSLPIIIHAIRLNNLPVTKYLLDLKADKIFPDMGYATIFNVVNMNDTSGKYKFMLKLLMQYGATGATPEQIAAVNTLPPDATWDENRNSASPPASGAAGGSGGAGAPVSGTNARVYTARNLEALSILQLNETATNRNIKNAYHTLALQHHPDKGGNAEQFKRIGSAYELLKRKGGSRRRNRRRRQRNKTRRSRR
jgi:hypothetical protein